MSHRSLALALVLVLAPALAAEEIGPLAWNVPPERMLVYKIVPLAGGKPAKGPERTWTVFGAELPPDREHQVRVSDYRDLALHFLFVLPKDKVKPGQKWAYEKILFERGVEAFPTGLSLLWGDRLDPVHVGGLYRFKGPEQIDGRTVLLLEGVFTVSAVKKGAAGKPLGTLKTFQYVTLGDPVLVRARYDIDVKGEEIQDIRKGFLRQTAKINTEEQLDLVSADRTLDHEAFAKEINNSIVQGQAWLKAQIRKDGSFREDQTYSEDFPVGSTALVLLALLHSGIKPDDPVIESGFAYIRRASCKHHTYDAAFFLQALEAKYLPFEKLEDVQHYNEEATRKALQAAITPADRALMEDAAAWLVSQMGRGGTWGYPDYNDTGFDNSNTQYALLGLKSAARCGVAIDAEVWKKGVKHFLGAQITTGDPQVELKIDWQWGDETAGEGETSAKSGPVSPRPWGYAVVPLKPIEKGYVAMTCAGLTSLIVCESELFAQGKLDKSLRTDIARAKREGLAALQETYSPRVSGPASGFWTTFFHYYLYGIERVGVLYGIKRIGGHDWYLEGARTLIETQLPDGHWVGDDLHPVTDTAFSLLFIKKATLRVLTKDVSKEE